MPFANRAHSTKIDKLLDDIDKHLENIQYAFIMVTALVIAADDASFYYVDAWKEGEEENPARDRLCALITMARAKSEELAREIDTAFKVLADRATWFVCWTANGDANAKVDEGIDEAMFVLESAGVRPLILLFDEDEAKHLGEKPLARLVALQERAIELLKPQTVEAAGAANEVMAEALALAKLLAEGEESRDWTDDDQETGESNAGEPDDEDKTGDEDEESEGKSAEGEGTEGEATAVKGGNGGAGEESKEGEDEPAAGEGEIDPAAEGERQTRGKGNRRRQKREE
jgi:hypothetical protein